jgi:hypothetical protein
VVEQAIRFDLPSLVVDALRRAAHERSKELLETHSGALIATELVLAEAGWLIDRQLEALAERLGLTMIATLDHRHFGIVRPSHIAVLTLLP